MNYRSHEISSLTNKIIDQEVTLAGWIHTRREHGEIIFVELRDRSGKMQLRFDQSVVSAENFTLIKQLKSESVIKVMGTIAQRPEEAINKKKERGDIDLLVKELTVLNTSETLPFVINKPAEASEALTLKYRYLDLRKDYYKEILKLRHEVVFTIRSFLVEKGFWEIETPILTKSTPEGARDFIVPSRHHPGTFYALPQSPQQYKELLMASGVEKYFQIARCLRDEDARADRQIEHTQIDMEMSFVEREDMLQLLEELMVSLAKKHSKKKLWKENLPRLKYDEAIDKYGSDKPDLRFDMPLMTFSEIFKDSTFPLFQTTLAENKSIRGLVAPGCADYSRKKVDNLTKLARTHGAPNLIAIAFLPDGGIKSSIKKFLTEEEVSQIKALCSCKEGDLVILSAGDYSAVSGGLGQVRYHFGKELKLADENMLALAFVVDFPLFEKDEENNRFDPVHHMFTRPLDDDLPLLDSDPLKVKSTQYDLVCNGYELCSGSIRIHTRDLQEKIMNLIGISKEDANDKFGHLLEAFDYGTPPHGGAAPGLDRLLMVLHGTENIKDVIAFPKSTTGKDVMMDAPSAIDLEQLDELQLKSIT